MDSTLKRAAFLIIFSIFIRNPAFALPTGGQCVYGQGNITELQNQMTIKQLSDQGIFQWNSFNILANESVRVEQINQNAVSLHRVDGMQGISNIYGKFTSNGTVILCNPAGIVFHKGSAIDMANFVATTLAMTDKDFINRKYQLNKIPRYSGSIRNEGDITVQEGGLVALLGPGVSNQGQIHAHRGHVVLDAGTSFTIDFGNKAIQFGVEDKVLEEIFDVDGNPVQCGISQTGFIFADGGQVTIATNIAEKIVEKTIDIGGIIEAKSIQNNNGKIILSGGEKGKVSVSGTLNASGLKSGETGGSVTVIGDSINIAKTTKIDARGHSGGGKIKVGGERKGQKDLQRSTFTNVETGAVLDASATDIGHGGDVVVWSDGTTLFDGAIYARGGVFSGNGGSIETSGKQYLSSSLIGSAGAYCGLPGEWLLDPADVNIVAGAGTTNGAFNGGNPNIWTPTTSLSTVGATLIANLLNAGTSVTIQTAGGTGGTGVISVNSAITANGAGAAGTTFSLLADNNIALSANVNTAANVVFTAGLTTNTATFTNNNTLTVTGTTNITAPGGITFTPALNGLSNTVNLNSSGNNGNILFSNTVNGAGAWTLTAGTGTITFNGAVGGATALGGLNIVSASLVNISGNISTNNAAITIPAPIVLTTNNSTLSAGTGVISLGNTINGARQLTLNSTGLTTLGGVIGGTTPLTRLTTNAGGTTSIATNISINNGNAAFGDNVILTGDVVVSTGTGTITFSGTVNGGHALTLDSTGTTTLTGAIGGTTPLTQLTTGAGGTTSLANNISTNNGDVSFGDNVTLVGNVVITTGTGNVTFGGTVNGARTLTINSTGLKTFMGVVGGTTGLTGLTTNAGGTTSVGANISTTNSPINFGDPLILTGDSTISAGTGNITFGSTIDGARALTVRSTGTTSLVGIVGGNTPLTSFTKALNGPTSIGNNITTNGIGGITFGGTGAVTLSANDVTFNSSAGNGPIAITGAITGAHAVTFIAGTGAVTLTGGAGSPTPLIGNGLTVTSASQVSIGGNITTQNAPITIPFPVLLTANSIMNSGTGIITLSTVNQARTLTLTSGDIRLNGSLGGTTALTGLTTNGPVTLGADILVATGGGNALFNGTINGAHAFTINSTGVTTFAAAVGSGTPLNSLTTNAGGTVSIAANISTNNGPVSFGENANLAGDVLISAGAGNVTFGGTINGGHALSVNSTGTTTLTGVIGGTTRLTSFSKISNGQTLVARNIFTNGLNGISFGGNVTLSTANVTLNSSAGNGPVNITGTVTGAHVLAFTAGSGVVTLGGGAGSPTPLTGLAFNSASLVNIGGNITTQNAAVSIPFPVVLMGNSNINTGTAAITLGSTVNGNFNLILTSTGTTTLNGVIGGTTRLASLTVTAGGNTTPLAGNISTNNLVQFGNSVTLTNNIAISSVSGNIEFNNALGSIVDGNFNLFLTTTGTTMLNGVIGGTTRLASLTVTAGGNTSLAGNISTNNLVQFGNSVTLTNNIAISSVSGNIEFNSTLNGNRNLTLNSGTGDILFVAPVGAINPLQTLTVSSARNVTAPFVVNVGSYLQTTGSGTTNFSNLLSTGNVTMNTSNILGAINGTATLLNGINGINASVTVSSLTLNGLHGGTVVGFVNGVGGLQAAILTQLGVGHQGIFTMNGFVLPASFPPTLTSVILSSTGILFPSFIYNGIFNSFLGEFIAPVVSGSRPNYPQILLPVLTNL